MQVAAGRWPRRLTAPLVRGLMVLGFLVALSLGPSASAGSPLIDGLPLIESRNGVLEATLEATERLARVGDVMVPGQVYNGVYGGPVLKAAPGDTLHIRLVNHLTEPTNLHFHGLQSAPTGRGDNMATLVAPGGSYEYVIEIPLTQPPGLYWYHSHSHGFAESQIMKGLSGALIISGAPSVFPASDTVAEHLFVFKDYVADDTGNARIDDHYQGLIQTINGETSIRLELSASETQLWHVSNQSADRIFHMALAGHKFRIVGRDASPSVTAEAVDSIDVLPAGRIDVLVDAGSAGTYELLSRKTLTDTDRDQREDRILGTVFVRETANTGAGEVLPGTPAAQADLSQSKIDETRTIVLSQSRYSRQYFIDGKRFDHSRVDMRVPLGHVEDWTIRNDSDEFHTFHIHQVNFQVMAINGRPLAYSGRVDTVRVPERGSITIRLPFTDPHIVGRFMYHCHVLLHEDLGMMAVIEVYEPATDAASHRFGPAVLNFCHHLWLWMMGVPWSYCGA